MIFYVGDQRILRVCKNLDLGLSGGTPRELTLDGLYVNCGALAALTAPGQMYG